MFNEFATDNLKIGVDVRINLVAISRMKNEEWLSAQGKKWRCRVCENPAINSELVKKCHWCGAALR
jgi:rubrerythrin